MPSRPIPARSPKPGNLLTHLPHWELLDGTVVLEDSRLSYGVELHPGSRLFLDESALQTAHRAHKLILRRGIEPGQTVRVHIEAHDLNPDELREYRDLPDSQYEIINDLAQARYNMQDQQRANGEIKRWRYYLTATLNAPTKFKKAARPERNELREALKKARGHRERLVSFLAGANLRPVAMDDQTVFESTYRYLNPGSTAAKVPRFLPLQERPKAGVLNGQPDPLTLRRQLCHSVLHNEDHIRLTVGNRHAAVLNLVSSPQWTIPDLLDRLFSELETGSFHVILEYTHLNPTDTTQKLEDTKQKLFALKSGNVPNTQAEVKLEMVNATIAHRENTGDDHYLVGMSVILFARDNRELEVMQQEALSALSNFPGALVASHGFQSYFQYLALVPFNGKKTQYPFEVTETTAADLIPASAPWPGFDQPTLLLRNSYRGLTKVDLFTTATDASHFAMFARTGWGKTFAIISILAAHIRRYDPHLTIVDRKEDFRFFIDALGGTVVPFFPGSGTQLNPMDLPEDELTPDPVKERFLMALVRIFVPPSSSSREAGEENALLLEAFKLTYMSAALDQRTPILSDVANTLESMQMYPDGRPIKPEQRDLAVSLALRFRPYLGESAWGQVIDRPTNRKTKAKHTYYDLSGIADSDTEMRRVAYLIIQDRIWSAVRALPLGMRKLAFMDEFGSQIKSEEDASFVDLQLRVGRSYNLAFGMATQDPDDMQRVKGLVGAIFYFLLGQLQSNTDLIQSVLKMPKSVENTVRTLRKGAGYREFALIYRDDNGLPDGGVIRMEESRLAYWLATSHAMDKPKRKEALEKHGNIVDAARELAEMVG